MHHNSLYSATRTSILVQQARWSSSFNSKPIGEESGTLIEKLNSNSEQTFDVF